MAKIRWFFVVENLFSTLPCFPLYVLKMSLYDGPLNEQSWYFIEPKRLSIAFNLTELLTTYLSHNYCMSKKSCPFFFSVSLYRNGQDLLDIKYDLFISLFYTECNKLERIYILRRHNFHYDYYWHAEYIDISFFVLLTCYF